MDPVNLDTVRRNAYRILGLTSGASQEQIDSAVRMMRLTASDNAVPPTARDAHWLGPVNRTTSDIEHAMMRLTDPQTRSLERLWWYSNQPPVMDDPAPMPARLNAEEIIRFRHDAAITTFCRLLIAGAGQSSFNRWIELLGEFREISSSDDYFHWTLSAESGGDFEKRASAEEMIELQSQVVQQAAASLAALADDFVDDENFSAAGRIIGMLNESSDGHPGAAKEARDRILNRLEDTFVSRCRETLERIDAAWSTKKINVIKPACLRAMSACEGILKVLFEEITKWCIEDPDREQRVRGHFAKVYVHIADAYEACRDKWSALQVLVKSVPAVTGTPIEPRIRRRIEELASAKQVTTVSQPQNTGGSWGGFRVGRFGLISLGIILLNVVRVCSTNTSSSSSSYSLPNQSGAPSQDPAINSELEKLLKRGAQNNPNPPPQPYIPVPSSPVTPGRIGR